ncbi:hypothetical protein ACLB2K_040632 [Fragaria x ananassa]
MILQETSVLEVDEKSAIWQLDDSSRVLEYFWTLKSNFSLSLVCSLLQVQLRAQSHFASPSCMRAEPSRLTFIYARGAISPRPYVRARSHLASPSYTHVEPSRLAFILKRTYIDDGVEMDETDESGNDTLQIMEDPVILIEDEEVGRDKSDEHGNSKSVGVDDITDETVFSSDWYAGLKGKNMKLLRFEDVKDIIFSSLAEADKFYAYYAFIVGFSRRCFKHDKTIINDVECVRRRAWCCSKQGYEDSAAKKKRKKVFETDKLVAEEAAHEKEEECNATLLN